MADATSPSAFILQMVRAHYGGDERAFNYAASALARHAKSDQVRREISSIVARGMRTTSQRYLPERGSPQQLQPAPTSSSLYALADVSFPELLLENQLQRLLDEVVVELEYAPALAERGLRARNRLLFHGPPGNGKTASAAALANALGARAYCVSIPQLVGSHMGETSKHVAEVFGQLRDGMVVVFDEIDAVGASRSQDNQAVAKEQNGVVNSMLQLLDRHKSGVVVGTTNRPDMLDPALRRRFDEQVLFPPPSVIQLRALALKLTEKFGIEPGVPVDDCLNFDEATKRVTTEARRQVMAELISADQDNESEGESDGSQETE